MTDGNDPADAPTPGLRERRRRETLRELSDAALDLFEEQGVHGTTVDDIVRRAGTSPRTFFRYYATKEAAVLPSTDDTVSQITAVAEAITRGDSLFRAIESNWLTVLTAFDAAPDEHARALRVRRLVGAEPTILALALRTEAEHADRLTDAAADATGPGADLITIRAAVAATSLLVRLAFEEWATRAEQGESVSVRETYLSLRRGLGALAAQLTDGPAD